MSRSSNSGDASDEDIEQQLSWRMIPEESLSDWTLIVTTSEDSCVSNEYHLHRTILAFGPCRSDYFAALFQKPMKETMTNTSTIEMAMDAADAVPLMLDFIYTQELAMITSEQAMSLRFLAEYFGIKLLLRKVVSFINDDMNITNVHRYLKLAKIFHDEDIRLLAQRCCIDNIMQMDTTSPLLPSLDLNFFHKVVSSSDIETSSASCHISTLVAAYCRLHQAELSPEVFDKLTDSVHMPVIDKKCSMRLLQLSAAAYPSTVLPNTGDMNTIKGSSCLQKRCIQVMSQHWKEFEGTGKVVTVATLPPIVIAELYGRTIENAKIEMAVVERELEVTREKLEVYEEQWRRMKRVPTLDSDHHTWGSYVDGSFRSHDYGRYASPILHLPPPVMPTIGNASLNGTIFLKEDADVDVLLPLFYYICPNA